MSMRVPTVGTWWYPQVLPLTLLLSQLHKNFLIASDEQTRT